MLSLLLGILIFGFVLPCAIWLWYGILEDTEILDKLRKKK